MMEEGRLQKERAVLVVGFLYGDEGDYLRACKLLAGDWGKPAVESDAVAFDSTDYYRPEMGEDLNRRICAFSVPIKPHQLKDFKETAKQVEATLSERGRRRINIDPGYLTPDKLVLATHKVYSFSVALSEDFSAVLELVHRSGSFQPLPWTYPDYRQMVKFFNGLRKRFFPGRVRKGGGKV